MPEALYFFVHLPKTAGQSVSAHLNRELENPERMAARYSRIDEEQPGYIDSLRAREDDLKVIHGHRVSRELIDRFPDRDTRPVVVLREPVQYLVSLFNYDHKDSGIVPDSPAAYALFDDWLVQHTDRQARWLVAVYGNKGFPYASGLSETELKDEVTALLETFWCVGNVVNLGPTLRPLFEGLGISKTMAGRRNEAGKAYDRLVGISPKLHERVLSLNPVDNEIYWNFATRKNPST